MAITLPGGFNITNNEPVDARITVADQSARLGFSSANVYEGLIVYQQDTDELYVLNDASDPSDNNNWSQVGEDFPYTGSAQITGSLGVSGSVGFSTLVTQPGSWSTQTSLSTARYALGGAGDQNAGLAFGGYAYPGGNFNVTEEFNGETWSNSNNLNTTRAWIAGFGSQNAAGALGGNIDSYWPSDPPVFSCTEHYNGNTWSNSDSLNTARSSFAAAGTQNATLAFGGYDTLNYYSPLTEAYNGLSWSAVNTLNNGRFAFAGGGTQNSAMAFGGYEYDFLLGCTEEWDGNTWSNLPTLSVGRYSLGGATTSTNSALAFGGYDGNTYGEVNCTEEWNGTTWTTQGGLNNTRYSLGGTGNVSTALAFGGYYRNGGVVTSFTEAYTPSLSTQCSFLSFNPTTQKINIVDGNITGSFLGDLTGSINLTSGDVIVPSGFELQADKACFINNFYSFGSAIHNTTINANCTKTYGSAEFKNCISQNVSQFIPSAFSNGGSLITGRSFLGGAGGSSNSALAFGGTSALSPLTGLTCTEEYDGTSWSTGGSLAQCRYCIAGIGSQNSSIAIGGQTSIGGPIVTSCIEEYNGTSWSSVDVNITPRLIPAATGITPDRTIIFGGESPVQNLPCNDTEEYDGVTWSTSSPMPQNFSKNTGIGRGRFYDNISAGGVNVRFGDCTNYVLELARNTCVWSYQSNILDKVEGAVGNGLVDINNRRSYLYSGKDGYFYDGLGWSKGAGVLTDSFTLYRAINGSVGVSQGAGIIFGGGTCTEEFTNPISNTTPFSVDLDGNLSNTGNLIFSQVSSSLDFVDDTAAAAGGVPLGGIYRSGSLIRIRLV